MYASEIVFIYNNLSYVSATHLAIFREAIQRLKKLKITVIVVTRTQIQSDNDELTMIK